MESIVILFFLFMRNAIKHSFEELQPFMNTKEQEGIYFYRILILLKMVFVLYTAESVLPEDDIWFILAVTNALTVVKYPQVSVLLMAIQGLTLPATSKKFALFSSAAFFYILSINVKFGEFVLDLFAVISLIIHSCQISNREYLKSRTVFFIKIFAVCYLYSLHAYDFTELFLIACFLFSTHIPSRPIAQNRHKYKILYIYALMLIWTACILKPADSREAQTIIGNFELIKNREFYECNVFSDDLERKILLRKYQKPKMANASITKLASKSLFDNLTSYSEIRENTCKRDDEKNKKADILDKNLKIFSIYEYNLIGKEKKKNFYSMKLKFLNYKNDYSKDHKFNQIPDVEISDKNIKSNNFLDYCNEDILAENLTHIDGKFNDEKDHSLDSNFLVITGKEQRSDDKGSMKNYIGRHQHISDKLDQSCDKNLPNLKDLEFVATINEHNFLGGFESRIDGKENFIPNVMKKTGVENSLKNKSTQQMKFTSLASEEIHKTSERNVLKKDGSMESAGTTYNVTFYKRCLYEFGKLTNDEKIKQIEQLLIDISKLNKIFESNLSSNQKNEEDKRVVESANENLLDIDSFVEKETGKSDDDKNKELNFQVIEEKNHKLKFLKSISEANNYRDDQKTTIMLDEDIALQNISDSLQKKDKENEASIKFVSSTKKTKKTLQYGAERKVKKPTRSPKMLIFNTSKDKHWLKSRKKVIKYKDFRITSDQKNSLILHEVITLRSILDSIQEQENKNKASCKSVFTTKETNETFITSDDKINAHKPARESEKSVMLSSRKCKEKLKNEKNVAENEEYFLNEFFENIELKNNVNRDKFLKISKHSEGNSTKKTAKPSKLEKFINEAPKRKTLFSLIKIIKILILNNRRNLMHTENFYTKNT